MALVAAAAPGPGHVAGKPLGRIERLVIENFKSYSGVHKIGPFDKFTCVIGPNGSGKSNIMDAISFCLGIRAKHLRGERLKDLVYRREEEDVERNTRAASVTLVFRTHRGDSLLYRREIDGRGNGRYMVGKSSEDMKAVDYETYLERLAEQEVNVRARNFLVFQGDVMELARRQGTDLTGMLETISGSVALKERYEKLAKDLELAQEKTRLHFQHRREIECSVALLEKQRALVEKYQELRQRRQDLIVEAVLFRLLSAEKEAERRREERDEVKAARDRSEVNLKTLRLQLVELEAQAKEANALAEEATSKHFVLTSNLQQLKPEAGNCSKQAAHWASKLRQTELEIAEETRRREEWEASVKRAQKERTEAEAEAERLRSLDLPSAVQMTAEQRAELDDAVAKTDATNSRTREQLRELDEQLRIAARALQADGRDLQDLEEQHASHEARAAELAKAKAALKAEISAEDGQNNERQELAEKAKQEVEKFVSFRNSLMEEQRAMRFRLDAAKARSERLQQTEAKQRVADELRDAFPDGVIGRFSEVVLPTQKRFELALQMSLSNMVDAFLVIDAKTGRDCVQYLKSKQISTETFLPLDRMVTPKVGNLHLLTRGAESRRLATMCVMHNEKFLENHPKWQGSGPGHISEAVKFLLSGTIVVDDLEEAKTCAYKDARSRHLMPRVVTLEGEVIAPNGNMLVNSISAAGRVEFGAGEQLKEIRAQEAKLLHIDQDLASLEDELQRTRRREAELSGDAHSSEEERRGRQRRLKAAAQAQASELQQLKARAQRIGELKEKISRGEKKRAAEEKKRRSLEEELLGASKQYFVRLSKSLGVDDIREILNKEHREKRELREKVDALEDQIRSLTNKEKALAQRLAGTQRLQNLNRDCEQYRRDIERAKERLKAIEQKSESLDKTVMEAHKRKSDAILQRERLDAESRAKRPEVQKARAAFEDTRKRWKVECDKLKTSLIVRCAIIRDSIDRQIELPMLRKTTKAALDVMSDRNIEEKSLEEIEAACKALQVDYAKLPEEKQKAAEVSNHESAREEQAAYEEQVVEVDKEMAELSPNMRAVDEHKAEEGKLKNIQREADAATAESDKLAREFEAVKAERVSKFMHCFKYVESVVNPTYKALTTYDDFQGGSAYLDLDDAEEPYNGGVTFTACPPGKRFFPMDLLSGGEKSMASMSLLFAMHSYRPPPFMILDEVDAPFDRKNTNSLVSYLRKLDFQCLVISLKDTFFSHSDSIVGIYKDKEAQTSGSVVLPLKQLGGEDASLDIVSPTPMLSPLPFGDDDDGADIN